MKKVALVLEGGAMRGTFTKGVLDCFKENNIEFEYVVGVSAGAMTGFDFVSDAGLDVADLFINFAKSMDSLKNSSEPISLNENAKATFPNLKFNRDEVKSKFEVSTVSLLDGNEKYFSLEDMTNVGRAIDMVMASSSLPDMAKPVVIDGIPYYDGGMYNAIPLERALDLGYEKVIAVLTRNRGYKREDSSASPLVKNALANFESFLNTMETEKVRYNESLEKIEEMEKNNTAIVFAPVNQLKFKSFTTNIQDLEDLYKEGYMLALEKIEEIREFLK